MGAMFLPAAPFFFLSSCGPCAWHPRPWHLLLENSHRAGVRVPSPRKRADVDRNRKMLSGEGDLSAIPNTLETYSPSHRTLSPQRGEGESEKRRNRLSLLFHRTGRSWQRRRFPQARSDQHGRSLPAFENLAAGQVEGRVFRVGGIALRSRRPCSLNP